MLSGCDALVCTHTACAVFVPHKICSPATLHQVWIHQLQTPVPGLFLTVFSARQKKASFSAGSLFFLCWSWDCEHLAATELGHLCMQPVSSQHAPERAISNKQGLACTEDWMEDCDTTVTNCIIDVICMCRQHELSWNSALLLWLSQQILKPQMRLTVCRNSAQMLGAG